MKNMTINQALNLDLTKGRWQLHCPRTGKDARIDDARTIAFLALGLSMQEELHLKDGKSNLLLFRIQNGWVTDPHPELGLAVHVAVRHTAEELAEGLERYAARRP